MKEMLVELAIKYGVCEFFDDLINNGIQLDFIKLEHFDLNPDNEALFIKLHKLKVPLEFNEHNKVLLHALKNGNYNFINYAIQNGAILTDDIIKASGCCDNPGRFLIQKDLVELLFRYNIDLSIYPNLLHVFLSYSSKNYSYEDLIYEAIDHGAVVTNEIIRELIKYKFIKPFAKAYYKYDFKLDVDDICLEECKYKKKNYGKNINYYIK